MSVTAKAILVTGANSGIGWAITKSLSEAGALVYATARKKRDFDSFSGLANVHPIILDVTRPKSVDHALREIRNERRGLYGLVRDGGGDKQSAIVLPSSPMIRLTSYPMSYVYGCSRI